MPHCMILESPTCSKLSCRVQARWGLQTKTQMTKRQNDNEPNPIVRMYSQWADLIAVRNNSPYGSARYNRAEAKAAELEDKASLQVFGDTKHTMTQCVYGEDPEDPAE